MEESSSSFSAIFNAQKNTLCLHEAELEITNGKCFIRGQAAFLREDIMPYEDIITVFLRRKVSYSCGFFLFILLKLSLLMVLLSSGAKCTDFIIPREVHVDEVGATTPDVAVAVAPPHQYSTCINFILSPS
jgi:hypothetical protein